LYASGNPGGSNADNLLLQAKHHLDPQLRFMVAQKVFYEMFGELPPDNVCNVDQIRGAEGARVKKIYARLAQENSIEWPGRKAYQSSDICNVAISHANAALYGLVEAVIVALGLSPAIGFVHSSDSRSFVFDVADCIKFKTVVPFAMQASKGFQGNIEGHIRRGCRDLFSSMKIADQIIKIVERLFSDESNSGNSNQVTTT
jgi:CRISPR-associated protein Cas1